MVSICRPPEARTAVGRSRPERRVVGQLDLRNVAVVLTGPLPNLRSGSPTEST